MMDRELHTWGMTAEQVQRLDALEERVEALDTKTTKRFRNYCWPVSDGSGFKSEKPRWRSNTKVFKTITYQCKLCYHEHIRCEEMEED